MKRIYKQTARKLYNTGKKITVVPCNCSPYSAYAGVFQKDNEDTFDKVINAFEYYNCNYSELGRYAAYYVED